MGKRKRVETTVATNSNDFWSAKRIRQDFNLPNEILIKIFSHLNKRDLCIASGVCKSWHKCALDESMWQIIDVSEFNLNLKQLWKLFRLVNRVKYAREIRVERNPKLKLESMTEALMKHITDKCPCLKVVKFSVMDLSQVSNNVFPCMLEELTLKRCEISLDWFENNQFQKLKTIDFSSSGCIRTTHLTHLLNSCKNTLLSLSLSNCFRVNDGSIEQVTNFSKLNYLNISGTSCTLFGIHLICTRLKNLISLDLSKLKLSVDRNFIKEAFKHQTNFKCTF
jgi:hypothetical protein